MNYDVHREFFLTHRPLFTKDQRQRWGDTQTHPVVNYGDLFFDLFFVGAAYNLSNIIRHSPTLQGFLYFLACFWAVFMLWWDKIDYDSRFFTYDDAFHRVFSVAVLVVLASVIVHIRPVEVLSNPSDNVEPFALSVSLLFAKVLSLCKYMEMLLIGCVGQNAALMTARRDARLRLGSVVLLWAASIYTGIKFFGNKENLQLSGEHRVLAEGQERSQFASEKTDIPIYLILASSLAYSFGNILQAFLLPNNFKAVTVPVNVTYIIHRIGEWIMLMLGESILSLLIVVSPTKGEYYITFFCSILSVVLLQYLHFRSQPSSPDDHAIRRKRSAGHAFSILMQIYSAALIILGVSYEMLLYGFTIQGEGYRRSLLPRPPRWLAGDIADPSFDSENIDTQVAHFFSASFAVVYFCSDAMLLAHRGLKDNLGRCRCPNSKRAKVKGILLIFLRVCIWVLMATLSQWQTDPTKLSAIGLASVIAQILLRFVASGVFVDERVHIDLKERQEMEVSEDVSIEEKE